MEELSPEVLILVCDRVCEDGALADLSRNWWHTVVCVASESRFCVLGVTRHEAQQWCLGHAFELVELNPQELPDEDGELKR